MIVVPTNYTYISDNSSKTQRCLEKSELKDVYKKYMLNEELTEEDFNKIENCINETTKIDNTVATIILVVSIIVIIVLIIWIASIFKELS